MNSILKFALFIRVTTNLRLVGSIRLKLPRGVLYHVFL